MHKLISFHTCPFVQRAAILLQEKSIPHSVEYIDLSNKPEWFLKISPRGKVPVLLANEVPLFESQAICEFLDETTPEPRLMPGDPLHRARDRAWFAVGSEDLFFPLHRLTTASEEASAREVLRGLHTTLSRLNSEMSGRRFLSGNGTSFGMADVAMAPFFFRTRLLSANGMVNLVEDFQNLKTWSELLNNRPSVQKSVPENFTHLTLLALEKNNAWILKANPKGGEKNAS